MTTRPPFDPELAPVEAMMRTAVPTPTIETLPAMREAVAGGFMGAEPTDLTAGDRVRVEDRRVPGPEGALATHPWIQAALDQTSLRQAAIRLHVHHSILQERLAWLEARGRA